MRVSAAAAANPSSIPPVVNMSPRAITSRKTLEALAPRVMRSPNLWEQFPVIAFQVRPAASPGA
jgi:hypothetical protein